MVEYNVINIIAKILGISSSVMKFPDFIFYVIIPFIVVSYAVYLFLKSLRIFTRTDFVNKALGVIIAFLSLRFIYPIAFVIAILYLVTNKRWLQSIWFRILFLIGLGVLYLYIFPLLSSLVQTFPTYP